MYCVLDLFTYRYTRGSVQHGVNCVETSCGDCGLKATSVQVSGWGYQCTGGRGYQCTGGWGYQCTGGWGYQCTGGRGMQCHSPGGEKRGRHRQLGSPLDSTGASLLPTAGATQHIAS